MQNNEHRFFGILCCWINVWYDYGCDAINSFRQNGFLRATLEFHWFETLGFCSFVWRTNLYFYQRSVFSIIMALLFCGGIFLVFLFQFFSLSVYFLWSRIIPFIISYFDFPLKIVFIVVFFRCLLFLMYVLMERNFNAMLFEEIRFFPSTIESSELREKMVYTSKWERVNLCYGILTH